MSNCLARIISNYKLDVISSFFGHFLFVGILKYFYKRMVSQKTKFFLWGAEMKF